MCVCVCMGISYLGSACSYHVLAFGLGSSGACDGAYVGVCNMGFAGSRLVSVIAASGLVVRSVGYMRALCFHSY